jgi:glyoxylase-like metal-dependent hydrolase (beta-lactamase superfamily II)
VALSIADGMAPDRTPGGRRSFPDAYHDPVDPAADWLEVGDRVLTRRYAFYNQQIGVVLGRGSVLVVDTRSTHRQARAILEDLRAITRDPVSVVVNTHWHHDHAFGNHVFRPATIWGHARCRDRLLTTAADARERFAAAWPNLVADVAEIVIDPPDRTFTEAATTEVGGRAVELSYLGRGHTEADIVVRVPDADTLFAGDLLEEGATPYFGDGYPIDWPATVERMLPLVRGPVVPGHGAVGDRSFVQRQLEDFRLVASLARRMHAGELDREATLAAMPFDAETSAEPLDRALAQLRGELD